MRFEEVTGHFTWGFEVSRLEPCGVEESWWVEDDAGLVEEHMKIAQAYDPVFARLSGTTSELGHWGHLGLYDRRFDLDEILEVRPASPEDCAR